MFLRRWVEWWMKPALQKLLNEEEEGTEMFERFDNFKKEMQKVFDNAHEKQTAEQLIQHLQQKTSAAEYFMRFQEQSWLIKWDDNALMTMYQWGLKDNVKDELMRHEVMIKTLKELMKAAIEIDDKLYKRAMKKRYDDPHSRAGTYTGTHTSYHQGGTGFFRRKNNFYAGTVSMELDSTQQRKGKNLRAKQDNDWNKNIKMCYSCGKPGHFTRDCQSKNMMQWWQINTMLREEPEDWMEEDTWEGTDCNSETSESSSDDDYFHMNSMEEFQDALEEKNSEKIVFMKTVNQLIKKVENEQQQELWDMKRQVNKSSQNADSELQQIQEVISELISSNTLLQKLA